METIRDILGIPAYRWHIRLAWRHKMMPGMIDPGEWFRTSEYADCRKEWEDYK